MEAGGGCAHWRLRVALVCGGSGGHQLRPPASWQRRSGALMVPMASRASTAGPMAASAGGRCSSGWRRLGGLFSRGVGVSCVQEVVLWCISQQFNKDDITAYEISCFLHPVSDIQLFILSIFRQELSIHLSALHCQMADMGARQQVMMRTGTQAKLHVQGYSGKGTNYPLNYHGRPNYPLEPQNRIFFTPNFANQTNNPPGLIRGGFDPTCVPSEAAPVRADAAADVQTGCRTMLGLIVTGIAGGALAQAALAEAAPG
uniref:Uncharacterized protein n=1 Tax=Oryza rufipogon TaxID=4529 RepID=A0A0E0PKK2_ORYRU